MANRFEADLEALKREKARQDDEWTKALTALASLGDVDLAIPRDRLDALAATVPSISRPMPGVRA